MPGPDTRPVVVHVVLSLNPGGAERLVLDLCRGLASDYRAVVCCLDAAGAWAGQLPADVPVEVLGRRPGFRPGLALALARVARITGARLLHCHQYSPFVYGTLTRLIRPHLPVLTTEHGRLTDAPATVKRHLANRLLNIVPSPTVAVSHALRRRLVDEGFPPGRVSVLHNGIASGPPPTPGDRHRARASLGCAPQDLLIGSVGRLDPVKDFDTLLTAMVQCGDAASPARLVLVGDGPARASLEARARALDLGDRVTFTGHRDDARALLPAFDVYVNSSRYEGLSLTILEAMAAGLPVVATAVGGTPEVLAPANAGGCLVPPADAAALAEALRLLAGDASRRRAWGAAARARVVEGFGLDAMLAGYATRYREMGAA